MRVPTRWRSRAPRTVRRWEHRTLRLRVPQWGRGELRTDAVDDTLVTGQGSAATVNVLVNDSDPNNDPLSVTTFTQGAHGQVACEPDGDCAYSPDAGFVSSDSFQYTISDGRAVWIPRPFTSRWARGRRSTQAATALSRRGRCSRGRVRSRIQMRIAGLRRSTMATGRVRCRCRWRRTRASSCRTRIRQRFLRGHGERG